MLIAFATFIMILAIPHISSESSLLGALLVMSAIRSLGAGIQTPAADAVFAVSTLRTTLMINIVTVILEWASHGVLFSIWA